MDTSATPTVFGRSLRLSEGDLLFAGGDLQMVAGRENFFQGMRVMIDTPFASDIFNIRYGFDLLACLSVPQSTVMVKELIRLNIVKSLSTDNRIRQIQEIVFDDELRFYELSPESDPDARRSLRQSSRQWQAIVVVQTVDEGSVNFKLEGTG